MLDDAHGGVSLCRGADIMDGSLRGGCSMAVRLYI